MKNTAFILLIFLFGSCRKEKIGLVPEKVRPPANPVIKSNDIQCFLKVNGKDSIKVQFTREGDSIWGAYHNLPYGIDKRISTFKGTVTGNSVSGISHYNYEGLAVAEEIAFTYNDSTLVLNYGATKEKGGIFRYKKGEAVKQHILPKAECTGKGLQY